MLETKQHVTKIRYTYVEMKYYFHELYYPFTWVVHEHDVTWIIVDRLTKNAHFFISKLKYLCS